MANIEADAAVRHESASVVLRELNLSTEAPGDICFRWADLLETQLKNRFSEDRNYSRNEIDILSVSRRTVKIICSRKNSEDVFDIEREPAIGLAQDQLLAQNSVRDKNRTWNKKEVSQYFIYAAGIPGEVFTKLCEEAGHNWAVNNVVDFKTLSRILAVVAFYVRRKFVDADMLPEFLTMGLDRKEKLKLYTQVLIEGRKRTVIKSNFVIPEKPIKVLRTGADPVKFEKVAHPLAGLPPVWNETRQLYEWADSINDPRIEKTLQMQDSVCVHRWKAQSPKGESIIVNCGNCHTSKILPSEIPNYGYNDSLPEDFI